MALDAEEETGADPEYKVNGNVKFDGWNYKDGPCL